MLSVIKTSFLPSNLKGLVASVLAGVYRSWGQINFRRVRFIAGSQPGIQDDTIVYYFCILYDGEATTRQDSNPRGKDEKPSNPS